MVDGRQPAEQAGPLLPDPLEALDALLGARRRRPSSLQALQVGDERGEVVAARVGTCGIRLPGLTCCGSAIQPARCAGVVRDRHRGERRARREVGEVGADVAVARACRGSGGSSAQPCVEEDAASALLPRRRRRARRLRHVREPRAELRPAAAATTVDRHVRVLEAAELRALPAVDARARSASSSDAVRAARGSGRSSGSAPGSRSCGSRRRSSPTTSTRVPTGMWISFAVTALRARVADLPPPLVADHVDGQPRRPARSAPPSSAMTKMSDQTKSAESSDDRQRDAEADDERVARALAAAERQPARGCGAASRGRAGRTTTPKPIQAADHHPPPEVRDRMLGWLFGSSAFSFAAAPCARASVNATSASARRRKRVVSVLRAIPEAGLARNAASRVPARG